MLYYIYLDYLLNFFFFLSLFLCSKEKKIHYSKLIVERDTY